MLKEVDSREITGEQPEQIMEVTLQEFDELVLDKKALDALLVDENFNRIFGEKYFHLEFQRLSGLLKSRNAKVIEDRGMIVEKIASIGHAENFLKQLLTNLKGIDNPEQRLELLRQIEEYENGMEESNVK